jgi:Zinc-binding domain of primase-helicase
VTLRKRGGKMVGPCPVCGGEKTNERFEATADSWVCAVCRDGGDVIKLVMLRQSLDFRGAVEWLGGTRAVDQAHEEKLARERAEKEAQREREAEIYRQRERGRNYDIWNMAKAAAGSPVEAYLRHRGLELPPGARLRYVASLPLYHGEELDDAGRKHPRVVHRGDAMIAPTVDNAGKFRGLHRTWIDLTKPKGKAVIIDPDTNEPITKGKKYGGKSAAAHVDLVGPRYPKQIIIAEGIETGLAVWLALSKVGRDLSQTAFWSALDLGNLGGRALDRVGRVPGPTPDLDAPSIALPDSVTDVVLLGDGDSDRVLTECALRRAAGRWASEHRTVRAAWAPVERDFNDLLMAA